MEMEPSRQRSRPSRSMYIVGEYGAGRAWWKTSQSTRLPICSVVLMTFNSRAFFILGLGVMVQEMTIHLARGFLWFGKRRFRQI